MADSHRLLKPFSIRDDEGRRTLPAGATYNPTPEQLRAMPDVFVKLGARAAPATPAPNEVPTETLGGKIAAMRNDQVSEYVAGTDDLEHLDEVLAAERSGKNRVGAIDAIEDRILELEEERQDGED
jgi:hypothetical protein